MVLDVESTSSWLTAEGSVVRQATRDFPFCLMTPLTGVKEKYREAFVSFHLAWLALEAVNH